MWRVREEKSATNFTHDKFHARGITRHNNGTREETHKSPHKANENFAGAIVNFITVATFCLVSAPLLLLPFFFVSVSYSRETRIYVGGKEDDENYVVTPGSSCQRSSTQRPRYVHGGCGNVSCAPRVLPRLPDKMGERKSAQKASIQS